MRCTYCGWDNVAQQTHCEKCDTTLTNAPLSVALQTASPIEPLRAVAEGFAGTIVGVQLPLEGITKTTSATDCGHCGYPNPAESAVCLNCQKTLNPSQVVDFQEQNSVTTFPNISQTVAFDAAVAPRFAATIDPYRTETLPVSGNCSLKPIERTGENTLEAVHFQAENATTVMLSRDKLDAENLTITSKTQAELTFQEGAWFIKDGSELETTFIQARRKMMLEDGDVILMGNRKFIFKKSVTSDDTPR